LIFEVKPVQGLRLDSFLSPRRLLQKIISTHEDLEHKQEVAGDTTNYHHLITTWLK
jgi:hypothetical protein